MFFEVIGRYLKFFFKYSFLRSLRFLKMKTSTAKFGNFLELEINSIVYVFKIAKRTISLHPTTQQPGWEIPRTDSLVIKEKVLRELFIDVTIPTSQALD